MRRIRFRTDHDEDAEHLMMIVGKIRTFRETIPYMMRNVVMMNRPMHIVLSLDCVEHEVLSLLNDMTSLRMPIRHVFITDGLRSFRDPCHVEFSLAYNVLDLMDTDPYRFVWVTRTDIMVTVPMSSRDVYEPTVHTWNRFMASPLSLHKTDTGRVIYDYIMTAGHPEYVADMDKQDEHIYWCPVNTHERHGKWLSDKIRSCLDEQGLAPHEVIRRICCDDRVCYLFGSTWFRFGFKEQILATIRACRGNDLTFEQIGLEGFGDRDHATEAQLRLAHFTQDIPLIDVIRQDDYRISFHEAEETPFHYVFILRADFRRYSLYPDLSKKL